MRRKLTCPRCALPLAAEPHETGVAWRCRKCSGQSLNFSQLRKLIPRLQANEIWLTVMENPVPPRWLGRCPECGTTLSAALIPFPAGEAELDVCLPCQRLWRDGQGRGLRLPENAPGFARAPGADLPVVRMEGRKHERRAFRPREAEEATPGWTVLSRLRRLLAQWLG